MSTRSFVGMMVDDKIRAIYVHCDGYLSGVGVDLQEYMTNHDVEDLISYGDRSSLDSGFYKDRGESNVDPVDYDSFDDFYQSCRDCWGEYYYIWKDGVWYCGDTYDKYEPTSLTRKLTPFREAYEQSKKA